MSFDKIAVIGATGQIGRLIIEILHERNFPVHEVVALATRGSKGRIVRYGNQELSVQSLSDYDFEGTDLAIFCVPKSAYIEHIPRAVEAGCMVIDNSNHYRTDPDVPLIIPEVNGAMVSQAVKKNIIGGANCATIQLLMAVKPLHDITPIKRLVVSTYHSASGVGFKALNELEDATKAALENKEFESAAFPQNLAFDVIPQAETFMLDGSTTGEWKMTHDVEKIMGKKIPLSVTAVRVPVKIGHAEAVNIEFEQEMSPEQAIDILQAAPGLVVRTKSDHYDTPSQIAGTDDVYVSRIRRDDSVRYGLNMWVVCDNLRKGSALNTVQIAECWLEFTMKGLPCPSYDAKSLPQ